MPLAAYPERNACLAVALDRPGGHGHVWKMVPCQGGPVNSLVVILTGFSCKGSKAGERWNLHWNLWRHSLTTYLPGSASWIQSRDDPRGFPLPYDRSDGSPLHAAFHGSRLVVRVSAEVVPSVEALGFQGIAFAQSKRNGRSAHSVSPSLCLRRPPNLILIEIKFKEMASLWIATNGKPP